ncbi:unnamed protein product [Vicia faba]|uniref:Uncharacterized protein n=1 Tax=Vicia faba TaxID=3906 RepID=A0AAV1B595_VICFA|nr:unnamed protein product [Vicia faba]
MFRSKSQGYDNFTVFVRQGWSRSESFTRNGKNHRNIKYVANFCGAIGREDGFRDGAIQNQFQFDHFKNDSSRAISHTRRALSHAECVTRETMTSLYLSKFPNILQNMKLRKELEARGILSDVFISQNRNARG